MPDALKRSIERQRQRLNDLLSQALHEQAQSLMDALPKQSDLDQRLRQIFHTLDHCKYLYVLDAEAHQLSSTVNRFGLDTEAIGRDRSERPYLLPILNTNADFQLSEAYISRNKKRPSLTAIQSIRNSQGERVGFLGVDYDLRELPHSEVIYEEPHQWRQIKGDPAIRQGLFSQQRAESLMDKHMDHVLFVHEALVLDQGVHHFQIHFSSSRSTIWHRDDPYVYRILTMDELADTNICLAYPRRPYFERAIVPPSHIKKILKQFKALRFADETIYLRSGSLNIVNGTVGLNFSCDGTHYINHDEFLAKGLEFWFGDLAATCEPLPVDTHQLDALIDTLATQGCMQVNKLLASLENEEIPATLNHLNPAERDYVYQELKSVMEVYEGGVCGI